MKTRLEQLQAFLEDSIDESTREQLQAAISDPSSDLRGFFHQMQQAESKAPLDAVSLSELLGDADEAEAGDSGATHALPPARTETVDLRAEKRAGRAWQWGAAIAASLLVGLFGGRLIRSGDNARATVLVAQVSVAREIGRGEKPVASVTLNSPLAGFATLVVLLPGGGLEFVPALGGEDINVEADTNLTLPPISFPDAEAAVAVVTPTPARMTIQKVLGQRQFGSDELAALQEFLTQALESKGYRQMALVPMEFRDE